MQSDIQKIQGRGCPGCEHCCPLDGCNCCLRKDEDECDRPKLLDTPTPNFPDTRKGKGIFPLIEIHAKEDTGNVYIGYPDENGNIPITPNPLPKITYNPWIKCSDKLPDKNKWVLICNGKDDGTYIAELKVYGRDYPYNNWNVAGPYYQDDNFEIDSFPYWMPLPEGPKDGMD